MIRKLFLLNLRALGVLYFKTGKKKVGVGRKIFFVFILLYVAVAFFFMFYAFFDAMLDPFFSAGIGWMYFAFLAFSAFGLSVIGSIFTASAQLFNAKDNELLLSMPIKPPEILLSRLFVILMFEYAYTAIIALPAFLIWIKSEYALAAGIVFFVIGVFLLPLMAMALSLLLAWLIGLLTSRLRHKNILYLVISIGFLAVYFYFAANIQKYLADLLNRGEEFASAFQRAIPPFYAFGKSIAEGSAIDGLIFMVWAIAPFSVSLILLSVNYRKILITNRGGAKTVYKEKTAKAGSVFSALLRKELAHYWSKPSIVLNTSMGSLFMLALAVIVIVKRVDILLNIDQMIPLLGDLRLAALGSVILIFLNTAIDVSASLISLEGKNLWIAKSIPVSPKVILQSKLCMHLLISSVPCLAASLCIAVIFALNAADWLMLILVPQAVGVLIAVCGLAVNLQFPKLDWTNEIHVVKQGLSAMVSMFGTMVTIIVLGLIYIFLLNKFVSPTEFLWLFTLLSAIIAFAIYAWLMRSGVKRFERL